MTLRTKSKSRQWGVWLSAALLLGVAYVVLSYCLYGALSWNPFDYRYHRLMLPLGAVFIFVAWETQWDGVVRKKVKVRREKAVHVRGEEKGKEKEEEGEAKDVEERHAETHGNATVAGPVVREKSQIPRPDERRTSGAEFFEQARVLPHQLIPNFEVDGLYLDLLGKSAAAGYAPALEKLGEYAMRRATWVEAYYWMTLAKRNGMSGLAPTLREIRQNWAMDGFPDQAENVSAFFSPEEGSLGRALLHLDSGQNAAGAREFLKANHLELLSSYPIFALSL